MPKIPLTLWIKEITISFRLYCYTYKYKQGEMLHLRNQAVLSFIWHWLPSLTPPITYLKKMKKFKMIVYKPGTKYQYSLRSRINYCPCSSCIKGSLKSLNHSLSICCSMVFYITSSWPYRLISKLLQTRTSLKEYLRILQQNIRECSGYCQHSNYRNLTKNFQQVIFS